MKRVVSISLGSSTRDHQVQTRILDQDVHIRRIGTDGDVRKAGELLCSLDGKVDAFGLGGIDIAIRVGARKYVFRDARRLLSNLSTTPIVDGSALKNTLEREAVTALADDPRLRLASRRVFLVCGIDRSGMAEAFSALGADVTYGDLISALGLPLPLKRLKTLHRVVRCIAPVVSRLPISFVYPTGKSQEQPTDGTRHHRYFDRADVIAGDFHFIQRNAPERMEGKIIITNTVTENDVRELASRGVRFLITTTPELAGRSFGTNVMEAVLVALAGKGPEALTAGEYRDYLRKLSFRPRIEELQSP